MQNKISNWCKAVIVLAALLFLMIFPPTRSLVVFLLPLGSGIDDLIFFILLFVTIMVVLFRLTDINVLKKMSAGFINERGCGWNLS